jgi:hypothetical protein
MLPRHMWEMVAHLPRWRGNPYNWHIRVAKVLRLNGMRRSFAELPFYSD